MLNIELGMSWSKNKQSFYCGDKTFTNDGPICTFPSHDLIHLLVATSGNLPWMPVGDDKLVRLAEYNAVFLENLCKHAFEYVETNVRADIISTVKKYMKWFVEEHYAPFPITYNTAYYHFCSKINASVIVRLCPLIFQQLKKEKKDSFLDAEHEISFRLTDTPIVEGSEAFQNLMKELFNQLKHHDSP